MAKTNLSGRQISAARPSISRWRTTNQGAVGFVFEAGTRLLAVEVKVGQRSGRRDIRHLPTFKREYGDAVAGCLLLHVGSDIFPLTDGVVACPRWSAL